MSFLEGPRNDSQSNAFCLYVQFKLFISEENLYFPFLSLTKGIDSSLHELECLPHLLKKSIFILYKSGADIEYTVFNPIVFLMDTVIFSFLNVRRCSPKALTSKTSFFAFQDHWGRRH